MVFHSIPNLLGENWDRCMGGIIQSDCAGSGLQVAKVKPQNMSIATVLLRSNIILIRQMDVGALNTL